ncbi:MAG: hypothetical protein HN576_14550 [Bacteriovoracaceae bacterium]|nr:hypothetical protein [Bacteriovoracaceae bacterium]
MRKWFILFSFLVFSSPNSGQAMDGAKVIDVSSTGRSIVLDRGTLEGLKEGMVGRLLLSNEELDKPNYTYVAYGKIIKVHSNYSYWYLSDINGKVFLDRGLKLLFVSMDRINKGRKKLELMRHKIVLRKGDTPLKFIKEKDKGVPSEMIKKNNNYEEGDKLTETYSPLTQDKEIYEFDIWSYDKGINYVDEYMQEVDVARSGMSEKIKNLTKYKKQYDKDLFNSVVGGSVRKINDYKYNLDTFYREQSKEEDMRQLRKAISIESIHKQYKNNKEKLKWVSPAALSKIKKGGKLWSVEMDDQQLRKFFIESGIRRENERQGLALETYDTNEILLFYSTGLHPHFTLGIEGFQGTNYSLGIGYEFFLRRTSKSLLRWSLDATFERTIAFYNVGSVNGRFTEAIGKLGIKYYIYNLPSSIYKWAWNLGVGIKRGNSEMQSLSLSKEYSYQMFGIPFSLTAKYRFNSGDEQDQTTTIGWGVNFTLSSEYYEISTVERIEDDILESFNVQDVRFSVGLSSYF